MNTLKMKFPIIVFNTKSQFLLLFIMFLMFMTTPSFALAPLNYNNQPSQYATITDYSPYVFELKQNINNKDFSIKDKLPKKSLNASEIHITSQKITFQKKNMNPISLSIPKQIEKECYDSLTIQLEYDEISTQLYWSFRYRDKNKDKNLYLLAFSNAKPIEKGIIITQNLIHKCYEQINSKGQIDETLIKQIKGNTQWVEWLSLNKDGSSYKAQIIKHNNKEYSISFPGENKNIESILLRIHVDPYMKVPVIELGQKTEGKTIIYASKTIKKNSKKVMKFIDFNINYVVEDYLQKTIDDDKIEKYRYYQKKKVPVQAQGKIVIPVELKSSEGEYYSIDLEINNTELLKNDECFAELDFWKTQDSSISVIKIKSGKNIFHYRLPDNIDFNELLKPKKKTITLPLITKIDDDIVHLNLKKNTKKHIRSSTSSTSIRTLLNQLIHSVLVDINATQIISNPYYEINPLLSPVSVAFEYLKDGKRYFMVVMSDSKEINITRAIIRAFDIVSSQVNQEDIIIQLVLKRQPEDDRRSEKYKSFFDYYKNKMNNLNCSFQQIDLTFFFKNSKNLQLKQIEYDTLSNENALNSIIKQIHGESPYLSAEHKKPKSIKRQIINNISPFLHNTSQLQQLEEILQRIYNIPHSIKYSPSHQIQAVLISCYLYQLLTKEPIYNDLEVSKKIVSTIEEKYLNIKEYAQYWERFCDHYGELLEYFLKVKNCECFCLQAMYNLTYIIKSEDKINPQRKKGTSC